MGADSVFWDDLAEDLEDPEFLRAFLLESVRITTVDSIINELDEAREAAHLSKAALARAVSTEPATVRRLLSTTGSNPTLGTVSELAAALGFRLTLEPLDDRHGSALASTLVAGEVQDLPALHAAINEFGRIGVK
ncbi:helix-turn-helix domain-containing protein [Rhodococcus sp. HNM0563]|uniref:helix-turn-helix domain-containing protein n=1 Tax=unclassified Rhodococcus (in: high G+C Gram-positive bacteria) TaxID=192944 RepID=UPI00146B94E5|nr:MULTISPECIES: helix-turn-helix domain-containing protein [unclassified Rhodococcus (in: high G+C Gram-positive bacteria)]MCK0090607.1 helix-turn-helix domain-containing protein [Rhodococcus sp. F64268]NLU61799.1 helix-turn-helix domain-containing protein [Rhodococcus sp. HNM0563]